MDNVLKYGVILIIQTLGALFFGATAGYTASRASSRFARNLRQDMYYNIQQYSFSNIDKFSTAGLVTRLPTDVTNMQMAYQMILRICFRAPVSMVCAMTMAFFINARLASVYLVAVLLLACALCAGCGAPAAPEIRQVRVDLDREGYALCIVDTGSSHGDLTDDYAAVTREMGAVAAHFGKSVLRDVPLEDFHAAVPALRQECGDRAVLRAMHFYDDDRTAVLEAAALKNGDFDFFLTLVNQSGLSSALHLQNTWSVHDPRQQAIPLALAEAERLLDRGAVRVHGGGFAGTIQAWVPLGDLEAFKNGMEALLGQGKCHVLRIRPVGGCVVAE